MAWSAALQAALMSADSAGLGPGLVGMWWAAAASRRRCGSLAAEAPADGRGMAQAAAAGACRWYRWTACSSTAAAEQQEACISVASFGQVRNFAPLPNRGYRCSMALNYENLKFHTCWR